MDGRAFRCIVSSDSGVGSKNLQWIVGCDDLTLHGANDNDDGTQT